LPYRSDAELLGLARGALARAPRLTAEERLTLAVTASGDSVRLSGNVLTSHSRETVVQAATQALMPTPVRTEITDDLSLEFRVSRALFQAGVTRSAMVHPRSRLGHLTLYGLAASASAAAEAQRIAAQVPGVRSVQSRLDIAA
jgi:osmotically-inducible protein OsmY